MPLHPHCTWHHHQRTAYAGQQLPPTRSPWDIQHESLLKLFPYYSTCGRPSRWPGDTYWPGQLVQLSSFQQIAGWGCYAGWGERDMISRLLRWATRLVVSQVGDVANSFYCRKLLIFFSKTINQGKLKPICPYDARHSQSEKGCHQAL